MYSGPLGEALQRQLLGHPYLHAGVVYIVLLVIGFGLGFSAGVVFGKYAEWLKWLKWLNTGLNIHHSDVVSRKPLSPERRSRESSRRLSPCVHK